MLIYKGDDTICTLSCGNLNAFYKIENNKPINIKVVTCNEGHESEPVKISYPTIITTFPENKLQLNSKPKIHLPLKNNQSNTSKSNGILKNKLPLCGTEISTSPIRSAQDNIMSLK